MSHEQLYYDTLKRIAKGYMTTEQLSRRAEKEYGVGYHEALEMSYDNIQAEAADAIRRKRRPATIVNGDSATRSERESDLPQKSAQPSQSTPTGTGDK